MAWFEKGIIYCSNRVLKLFAALEEAQVRVKGKETRFLKVKKACFEEKRLGLREGYFLLHQQSFETVWCFRRSTGTVEGKRGVF